MSVYLDPAPGSHIQAIKLRESYFDKDTEVEYVHTAVDNARIANTKYIIYTESNWDYSSGTWSHKYCVRWERKVEQWTVLHAFDTDLARTVFIQRAILYHQNPTWKEQVHTHIEWKADGSTS